MIMTDNKNTSDVNFRNDDDNGPDNEKWTIATMATREGQ